MFLIVHSASKAFNDAKNVSTSTQPYEFARQREEEEELENGEIDEPSLVLGHPGYMYKSNHGLRNSDSKIKFLLKTN